MTAHPRLVLTATILASSLAFVDGSVVNLALPTIGRSFAASPAELQWTVNAYLLPLSALLLMGGAAGDYFGRKRLLIVGIILFLAASIGCALAPSLAMFLPARALQGAGAAMLMPNSLAILGHAFSGDERGRAIGTWAAAGAAAAAIGPPLGGWLVGAVGWRSVFFINVPVALAAIAIAARWIDDSNHAQKRDPLDWTGAILATCALAAFTWALTRWSNRHVVDAEVALGLVLGAFAAGAFLFAERRRGDGAMVPLAMFSSASFVGLSTMTFLFYAALGGFFLLFPYVLMVGGHWAPRDAGLALLPFPVILGVASRPMGGLAGRIGPRLPLAIGASIAGVGFAGMAFVDPNASYWTGAFPALLVIAGGTAGAVAPLTAAVLSSVDDRHTGTASGINSAIARTGGLVATALAGAVIAASGADLVAAFHIAAWIGAGLALAAGASAFLALGRSRAGPM